MGREPIFTCEALPDALAQLATGRLRIRSRVHEVLPSGWHAVRHIIGWLDRPTKDGRILRDLKFKAQVPVLKHDSCVPQVNDIVGIAADFQIIDNVITCKTTADVPDGWIMSMAVDNVHVEHPHEGLIEMSGGTLVGLQLFPTEDWAWEQV